MWFANVDKCVKLNKIDPKNDCRITGLHQMHVFFSDVHQYTWYTCEKIFPSSYETIIYSRASTCRAVDELMIRDNVTMAPFLFVPGKLEDLEIMLISFISQLKFSLWRGINLSSFLYIDIIFVILNIRFVPKNQTKKSLEKSGGGGLLMGILEGVKVSCYPLPWLFPEDAVCWSASIRSFWTWAIIAVLT